MTTKDEMWFDDATTPKAGNRRRTGTTEHDLQHEYAKYRRAEMIAILRRFRAP